MKKKNYKLAVLLIGWVVISLTGCAQDSKSVQGDEIEYSPAVLSENELMQQFIVNHPDKPVLKYAQADLDNDGVNDLIVIYAIARDKNMMSVLLYKESKAEETNSVPAPVSDQMIQFRNIDDRPPLEFIVQGRKGAKVGYAIFRVEKGILTDLFGEGMDDCC